MNIIRQALTEPLGLPKLDQLFFEGDKIAVVPDEQHALQGGVLREVVSAFLDAGAKPEQITVLLTENEERSADAKLKRELPDGVKWSFHHGGRREHLARLGVNDEDKPIMLCRELVDADLVLTVGRYHKRSPKDYYGVHHSVFPRFSDSETQQRFLRPSQKRKLETEVQQVGDYLGVIFTLQILYERGTIKRADTDPQRTGVPVLEPAVHNGVKCAESEKTAKIAKEFHAQAVKILANEPKANNHTMRGFAKKPHMPSYQELYALKSACVAVYPMYKGLASFAGMTLVGKPATLEEEIDVLEKEWGNYDFFFVHFKYTDSRGEDGDFDAKVKMIEELDKVLPRIQALKPACLVVTGDHSTPAKMASHSFHPVPTLIVSDLARTDETEHYGEKDAAHGGLGQFEAQYIMPLALAHAGRLGKFGA